jgi:glycosyltransferase involved in cell wall biosynthesis
MALLEVIIPIKDRVEVKECVSSLIHAAGKDVSITLCDGGTSDPECVQVLQELNQRDLVHIIHYPIQGFNKAKLLNRGIGESQADLLLVSDSDIVWNQGALEILTNKVLSEDQIICHVKNVKESDSESVALKRDRYSYNIYNNGNSILAEIILAFKSEGDDRPGCGLVCARKETFLALGGYKELFDGWGWEDQDLLIRAHVLGMPIYADGCVMHISHSDILRNMHNDYLQPSLTRNKNIVICAQSLSSGTVLGDLSTNQMELPNYEIQVRLPESLSFDYI